MAGHEGPPLLYHSMLQNDIVYVVGSENIHMTKDTLYMQNIKVVILDFDNTLILDEASGVGSEEKKHDAWYGVFPEIPADTLSTRLDELQRKIVGGKGDRMDIIRALCADVGAPEDGAEYARRNESFNAKVQEGVLEIGMSTEKREVLRALAGRYKLYLNSATLLPALRESLDALGIGDVFIGIYGRPGTKESNLREIIAHAQVNPQDVLCVDDQPKAYEIARAVGCQFIGMRTSAVQWPEDGPRTVGSLMEFGEFLGVEV